MKSKVTRRILLICLIALLLALAIGFVYVISEFWYSFVLSLTNKETDIYNDYICPDPNLTWEDTNAEYLHRYLYLGNATEYRYYRIDDMDEKRFIGAAMVDLWVFPDPNYNTLFVKPDDDFSPWKDWTVSEITLSNNSSSVIIGDKAINAFVAYLPGAVERALKKHHPWESDADTSDTTDISSNTETTESSLGSETEVKEIIDSVTYRFTIRFNETESVFWQAEILLDKLADGTLLPQTVLTRFDEDHNHRDERELIPEDSEIYPFILDAIQELEESQNQ